jgi:hypothetical protein
VKYASEKPKSGSLRTFYNDGLMRNVEKLMDVRMLKKDGERDGREVNNTSVAWLVTRKEQKVVGMMTTPRGKLRLNKYHQGSKTNMRGLGSCEQYRTNQMSTSPKTDNLICSFEILDDI